MSQSFVDNLTSGVGGDQNAPSFIGDRSQQANAEGSIAAGGSVRIESTDSRNYGTSLDGVKVGAGGTLNVTTADPALAAMAIQANSDTARAALASNLASQSMAFDLAAATTAGAMGLSTDAIAAFNALDDRRSAAVSQTINASLDQAREASARSQQVVENALGKLAEQRAPDAGPVLRLALVVAALLALVFGLRAWRGR